jgi:D-alanyl-D-alanine carboxypeptidase (penicillin-binding protein 5/6)
MFKKIILPLFLVLSILSSLGVSASDFSVYPLDIAAESFWFDEYVNEEGKEAFSPSYSSRASLLMEASSGKVICANNENQRVPIASVTKIMSILLTVEAIDDGKISLSDNVTVSEYASSMGGSQVFLEAGEKMTVDDLLKSLIVVSANDAAVALAEHIYGNVSEFIKAMNEKANILGMNNTQFKNTTGLDEDGHFSSALDVALMTRELLKHEIIFDYTCIWMDTIRNGAFGLSNTNRLVRFYDGANGMKTGFTDKAMYCLSGTAKRDGMQLIAVILGAESSNDRFAATKELLDYGFANYTVISPEKLYIENLDVNGGEKNTVSADYTPISILTKKGDKNKVTQTAFFDENIIAPIKRGEVLGKVVYYIDDKEVGESVILASENIRKADFGIMFEKIWSGILNGIF